jgi:hypothetical protein
MSRIIRSFLGEVNGHQIEDQQIYYATIEIDEKRGPLNNLETEYVAKYFEDGLSAFYIETIDEMEKYLLNYSKTINELTGLDEAIDEKFSEYRRTPEEVDKIIEKINSGEMNGIELLDILVDRNKEGYDINFDFEQALLTKYNTHKKIEMEEKNFEYVNNYLIHGNITQDQVVKIALGNVYNYGNVEHVIENFVDIFKNDENGGKKFFHLFILDEELSDIAIENDDVTLETMEFQDPVVNLPIEHIIDNFIDVYKSKKEESKEMLNLLISEDFLYDIVVENEDGEIRNYDEDEIHHLACNNIYELIGNAEILEIHELTNEIEIYNFDTKEKQFIDIFEDQSEESIESPKKKNKLRM